MNSRVCHCNILTFHSQRLLLKRKVSQDGLLCYVNIEDVLLLVVLAVKFFCYLLIVNLQTQEFKVHQQVVFQPKIKAQYTVFIQQTFPESYYRSYSFFYFTLTLPQIFLWITGRKSYLKILQPLNAMRKTWIFLFFTVGSQKCIQSWEFIKNKIQSLAGELNFDISQSSELEASLTLTGPLSKYQIA